MDNLRKLQLIELEIMDEFVRVCDALGIQYFITCGTALGAVRHGGFIPWDDDMDIGLLREDYEKFVKYAPGILEDNYWLEAETTDKDFNQLIIKLRKKNTVFKSLYEKDKICNGIFIDVYAFDLLPDNGLKRKFAIKYAQILRWLHILRNTEKRPVQKGRSLKWRVQEGMLRVVHPMMCVFKKDYFRKKMDKFITKWNDKNTNWITCHFDSQPISMKTEDFFPLKSIRFEDKDYLIMKNEDEYLRQMYGSYMEIPPEDKRITHMPEILKF